MYWRCQRADYDKALAALITINTNAFTQSIGDGELDAGPQSFSPDAPSCSP
jgi:hypothetical protein